ncbi:MAG: radical SAM protein [Firmicutes bacterium]|nr:radical SAM protein [Bacillota bacterium]
MSKKHYIIPIFVPHLGCPNDCVFCNQRKITGLSTNMTGRDVKNIVESFLKTIPKENTNIGLAFYGGSFTGIDKKIQKELISTANNYKKSGLIDSIRLSTRPDYIDDEILSYLRKMGVDTIELGVQSLDEKVLENSLRGHTSKDVYKAVKLIKKYEFKLGLQMMTGLPGDSLNKSLDTGIKIAKLKPNFTRIYPTLTVKETKLQKLYYEGKYKPFTLDETISLCSELLMLFELNNIEVIRIGLQNTENISTDKDVVAGPFHSSLRQLVESRVYRIILDEILKVFTDKTYETLVISANKKEINYIIGYKAKNTKYLKTKYGFKKINYIKSKLSKNIFYVETDGVKKKVNRYDIIKKYLQDKNLLLS